MQAEQQATAVDCLASEDAERLLSLNAKVIVRMGADGRETMWLPLYRAIPLSERFNRRMERAGLSWRSRIVIQP